MRWPRFFSRPEPPPAAEPGASVLPSGEVPPPWVKYPGEDPWWGGWRQGNGESWLHDVWSPFWKRLSRAERIAYTEKWNPPGDDWREYILVKWSEDTVRIASNLSYEELGYVRGLEIAVVGLTADGDAMRWHVHAALDGISGWHDGFWVRLSDFDHFASSLEECSRTGTGCAVLCGTGEDMLRLELGYSEPDGIPVLRFELTRSTGTGERRYRQSASGEFELEPERFRHAIEQIATLREPPLDPSNG